MFGASTPFCLTAPPTPTLFGVFTFHRRSPFITGVCTPSIRCLYNSSSFHPCMHWKGLRLLFSLRAQETSIVHNFSQSLLWASSGNTSSPCTCCLIVVPRWITGTPAQSMCPRAISILQISPYSLLMFDSSSSCHNTYQSQNRVSIFNPLLYLSSIIRVFINSPFEKSQSPNLTSLEKSPLYQILEYTKPNCSFMSSSC
jgi:hypothetical protein